jgi:hypothetical protein
MAIKVAVLEGDFAAICDLGLPFSLSLQLQSFDLKLSEALWTAKSSSSGFFVSLYWPSGAMTRKVKTKKRRCRNRPKASVINTITDLATSTASASAFNGHSGTPTSNKAANKPLSTTASPPEEIPATHETSSASMTESDSEVDLLCDSVSYEKRGITHGVSYHDSASNKYGWTPVIGRRKKTPLPNFVLQ